MKIGGRPIKHLYIIGNGFDMFHGAKSSYWDFRKYLLRRDPYIVKSFELLFGPRSIGRSIPLNALSWYFEEIPGQRPPKNVWVKDWLWADFENHLSGLNREKIFDLIDILLPWADEEDEDFIYADFFMPIDQIKERVYKCSHEMRFRFHKWINTLSYRHGFKKNMLSLDQEAAFLNFNYTLFLEAEYHIPHNQICYIHGSRKDPYGSLILGHSLETERGLDEWIYKNKNRRRYRHNLKDKYGRYFPNYHLAYLAYFTRRGAEDENWIYPVRYYALDYAIDAFAAYYEDTYKNTQQVISKHAEFFNSLSQVEQITVIGHSMSKVDLPYFRKIIASVNQPELVKWSISYHSGNPDLLRHKIAKQLNYPTLENAHTFRL